MASERGADQRPVVTVVKQKLHGGRACWQSYAVRNDDDGQWLFTPAGSTFRASDGTRDERCEVEGGGGSGMDSLILVPDPAHRWLATWRDRRRPIEISIEVCGWLRRDDGTCVFLDWELDPFRLRSGLVAVEDIDDFVAARDAGRLSADDAELALRSAAWTERTLRSRSTPFDGRGDRHLLDAAQLRLPPLTDVPHPFEVQTS